MFCPKCGADEQSAESYCKRCGEWLPDLDALTRPGLFRKLTRQERIGKMRRLEAISAGLSFIALFVIMTVLTGGNDKQFLFLAAICCFLVAIYQLINLYFGYQLEKRGAPRHTEEKPAIKANPAKSLQAAGEAQSNRLTGVSSVVENTTELLEPVPRVATRKQS